MASQTAETPSPVSIVGTCIGMCPNAEVRLRQREKLIHPMEMAVDSNGGRLSYAQPQAMVKQFSRSAAGHEIKASDVRPPPVLTKTVKYLLRNVCCRQDVPWTLIYEFVSDRLRAVRQDLCVQGVRNMTSIIIYQAAVRFYIYAHYRMCEHDITNYDPYLNMKQLNETLSTLISSFRDVDSETDQKGENKPSFPHDSSFSYCEESEDEEAPNTDSDEEGSESKIVNDSKRSEKRNKSQEDDRIADTTTRMQNLQISEMFPISKDNFRPPVAVQSYSLREEAEAMFLIVNFGNEEILLQALELPKVLRCSRLVSLAIQMNTAWLSCNYYRVLRLSAYLPLLLLCAFHRHLTTIQRRALHILNQAHSGKGLVYSREDLASVLHYPGSYQVSEAAQHYSLTVEDRGVIFTRGKFNLDAPLVKPTKGKEIEDKLSSLNLGDLLFPLTLE